MAQVVTIIEQCIRHEILKEILEPSAVDSSKHVPRHGLQGIRIYAL